MPGLDYFQHPPGLGPFSMESDKGLVRELLEGVVLRQLEKLLDQGKLHHYRMLMSLREALFEGLGNGRHLEPPSIVALIESAAIKSSQADIYVETFLLKYGFGSPCEKDESGWTPLHDAAVAGDPVIMRSLIALQANVSAALLSHDADFLVLAGHTPIALSIRFSRNVAATRCLLLSGVSANETVTLRGVVPLHGWAQIGSREVLDCLVAFRADLNNANNRLGLGSELEHQRGASAECPDTAAHCEHELRMLVEARCAVDARVDLGSENPLGAGAVLHRLGHDGNLSKWAFHVAGATVLLLAMTRGNLGFVQGLLEARADPQIKRGAFDERLVQVTSMGRLDGGGGFRGGFRLGSGRSKPPLVCCGALEVYGEGWGFAGRDVKRRLGSYPSEDDRGRRRTGMAAAWVHLDRKGSVSTSVERVGRALASKLDVLCFDEVAITTIQDCVVLGPLLRVLCRSGVVIVATSNRAPEDLYSGGLNRHIHLPPVAQAIHEHCRLHCIESQVDHRERQALEEEAEGGGAGVFLWNCLPGSAEGERFLSSWMERTTGCSDAVAGARRKLVEVGYGRTLLVVQSACGTCARFTFQGLCDACLGDQDFAALCGQFRCIQVADVPRLRAGAHSEAQRWIWLLDFCYERQTQLVLTSVAEAPEDLVDLRAVASSGSGGGRSLQEVSFAVARMTSRLREMQTMAYSSASLEKGRAGLR
ncbi:unnamed protein product [Polarella glacialis]|uniref:Uncharacterized protein n=1 Tax=Polarella glacialis TaxID=89957 RepID=A0A813FET3_POLGL|nr:unnamed protein product [Polarella glacialis]